MNQIRNLSRKIINKLKWYAEEIHWFLIFNHFLIPKINQNQLFTIGITTFLDRYEGYFKPLLKRVILLFPDCQIIIIANGHVKQEEQTHFLINIKEFCLGFKNVILLTHFEPKGLSLLWNQILKQSNFEKILILNDDIRLMKSFREFIIESRILNTNIATINSSWSHFMISKSIIEKVGWFDEGLVEIGGEDDDYAARLAISNIKVDNFFTHTITRKGRRVRINLKINSYGKYMAKERNGYSTLNTEYLEKKWEMSEVCFEGATEVPGRKIRFWKMRNSFAVLGTEPNDLK